MDTKIQFRVDKETKHIPHNDWITEQVNLAFERLEDNIAQFVSNEEARISYEITMD